MDSPGCETTLGHVLATGGTTGHPKMGHPKMGLKPPHGIYTLVNVYMAIENCHRNSRFSHEIW